MASREIKASLKRNAVAFECVHFAWRPNPGEMASCYEVLLTTSAADAYDECALNVFEDTDEALEWVESLALFDEKAAKEQQA